MSAYVEPPPRASLMFTDIEGSTKLLERLRDGYANVLDDHRSILREAFERHGGREIDTQGDSFFVAFDSAAQAVACAVEMQRELAAHQWPDGAVVHVRIGIHTGTPTVTPTGLVGIDVHRAARVGAAAHGGQVLATEATAAAAGDLPAGVELQSLGVFRFKGLDDPLTVLQVRAPGLSTDFPAIRTSAPEDEPPSPGESPYKGLMRFEETDADRFFGREQVVSTIADTVEQQPFVAVVGASGSGKSSIVRAGVAPSLRRSGHKLLVVTPTSDPFAAVAAALSMDDGVKAIQRFALVKRAVLVIDQLEELFTLCRTEAVRHEFLAALMAAMARGVHVLVTLRADFYAEVAAFPDLRAQVAEHQFYVGPMEPADLRRAIEEPARQGGWDLAPGLVDLLLRDVGAEPGALPLLSHALLETWLRRRGSRLTLKGYFESGEVRGAIARTADRLYVDLLPAEQHIAREVLLRLTELGEGTQDTRRRVTLDELVGEGRRTDGTSDVLRQLVDARLVTVDEGTAEVAHEALIREWPLLREWLAQDRDGLRLQRALTDTSGEWQILNHDPSLLYRGARLAAAREFAFAHPHSLNAREREFVEASLDAEEAETREREEQQKRELEAARRAADAERRRAEDQVAANRRLRRRAVILVGAVLLAVGLGVLAAFLGKQAMDQAAEAQAQATAANEQKQIALSRQLSAQSTTARDNLDLSLLLALEANREADTLEARSSLLGALLDEPGLLGYIRGAAAQPSFAMTPDGKTIALGFGAPRGANGDTTGANVELVDLDSRAVTDTALTGVAVALSQDGRLALTGDANGKVTLWSVEGATHLADLPGMDGYIDWVAFGDGGKVAIADNHGLDRLTFWDVDSRQLLSSFEQARTLSIAVSADGDTLARDTVEGGLQTFRVADQKPLAQAQTDYTTGPHSLAFSPDGKTLAAASGQNVSFFDAQTLTPIGDPHPSGLPAVDGIAFSPDGSLLALGGSEGTIALWDPATGVEARQALKGHADTVYDLAFTPNGQTLVVGNRDGTVSFWDLSESSRLAKSAAGLTGPISSVAYSRNGRLYGAADATGLVRVWDATTGRQLGSDVQAPTRVPGTDLDLPPVIAFSPDGRLVGSANHDGSVTFWDTATLQRIGPTLLSGKPLSSGGKVDEEGTLAELSSIAFSADGKTVVAGSGEGSIYVWTYDTAATGEQLPAATADGPAGHLLISPDGRLLVTTNATDGSIKLWDMTALKPTATLTSPDLEVGNATAALSPDGNLLATDAGGGDQPTSIVLWDVQSRTRLATLPGQTGFIRQIAFSPDGRLIASAANDGTVMLTEVAQRLPLGFLPVSASSLSFSADGRTLLVGDDGGDVSLWDVSLDGWENAACRVAGRNLTQDEWNRYLRSEPYQPTCPGLP